MLNLKKTTIFILLLLTFSIKISFAQEISSFESDRLSFRLAQNETDLNNILNTIKEREDLNFMWGPSFTLKRVKQIYQRRFYCNQYFLNENKDIPNFLIWIVENKEAKDYIGYAGISLKKNDYLQNIVLLDKNSNKLHDLFKDKMIAKFYIAVYPSKRTHGYAYEIEQSIIDKLFTHANIDVFFHTCSEKNIASKKLAEKLNLHYQGSFFDGDKLENVYTIDADTYLIQKAVKLSIEY
jgi:RimJ/RimL family protein N-acetyltransferase